MCEKRKKRKGDREALGLTAVVERVAVPRQADGRGGSGGGSGLLSVSSVTGSRAGGRRGCCCCRLLLSPDGAFLEEDLLARGRYLRVLFCKREEDGENSQSQVIQGRRKRIARESSSSQVDPSKEEEKKKRRGWMAISSRVDGGGIFAARRPLSVTVKKARRKFTLHVGISSPLSPFLLLQGMI